MLSGFRYLLREKLDVGVIEALHFRDAESKEQEHNKAGLHVAKRFEANLHALQQNQAALNQKAEESSQLITLASSKVTRHKDTFRRLQQQLETVPSVMKSLSELHESIEKACQLIEDLELLLTEAEEAHLMKGLKSWEKYEEMETRRYYQKRQLELHRVEDQMYAESKAMKRQKEGIIPPSRKGKRVPEPDAAKQATVKHRGEEEPHSSDKEDAPTVNKKEEEEEEEEAAAARKTIDEGQQETKGTKEPQEAETESEADTKAQEQSVRADPEGKVTEEAETKEKEI